MSALDCCATTSGATMSDRIVLEARIEQAACAERMKDAYPDCFLSDDFRDGVERAARIAVETLKPREITTVEELDELPDESIIQIRRLAYQKLDGEWWAPTEPISFEPYELVEFGSSPRVQPGIVVLYTPEER
ncbi:hypothetical protein M1M07_24600 [Rhodococcus sp. HM1]|uniref:hypothetical protein n=1 Tax=Rhodococcus sp. HM1 TaxID=2937759 RepID=UPI00200AFF6E|nr:hypothetical protein [Rhodococcus sp. HM1]MCK8674280.1 hypothetical protein [Rhodococcus sp. HM1]